MRQDAGSTSSLQADPWDLGSAGRPKESGLSSPEACCTQISVFLAFSFKHSWIAYHFGDTLVLETPQLYKLDQLV